MQLLVPAVWVCLMPNNGPVPRRVCVDWSGGKPTFVTAEPKFVSPQRAQEIFDVEQSKRFPWQGSGLAGDMTPEEYAWMLWYWEQLPGHYSMYTAICKRARDEE